MEIASAYIPIDRRQAMLSGEDLPERTTGAALFADISGFTPLTEALERELGPKRGGEELTVHLNRVYDALVEEVHRYGGSIIGFAGDAITCWFDGDDGRRATTSALAMQVTMAEFAEIRTQFGRVISLGIKVAVATGPVRRFLTGMDDYVIVDAMAGKTLENLAAAEHQAERGEVILDEAAAAALAEYLAISEWRTDEHGDQRFAAVTGLTLDVPEIPWPEMADDAFPEEQKRAWLLPAIYPRLASGQGMFVAELRPAVALFIRFSGINYDSDQSAPQQLDHFIQTVSQILMRYGGSLIQLTIGDKGSYMYAAFGAPVAHEDDAVRAGSAALDIRAAAGEMAFLEPLQVGIAQGRMRTGAYGGQARRTYGVLGDNVILAARLMSAAEPGQILVSDPARLAMGQHFAWQRLDDIRVKGKSEPIELSQLLHVKRRRQMGLHEPRYALPMVGRTAELQLAEARFEGVLRGQGQIIGLTAEAGMGKSRLAAEIIDRAQERGLAVYAGECNSYGTSSSYMVWQDVWRGIFALDPTDLLERQIQDVAESLARIDQSLVARLPLLQSILKLSIADNDLTASLDARTRKTALESLLLACLESQARLAPMLIVLEDIHWIDPLSGDLLVEIGRAIANLPVCLLLVYRPPASEMEQAASHVPGLSQLPHFSEIALQDFTPDEAELLITLKLQQFFSADSAPDAAFVEAISEKAAGNPFYIEEILNYLRDLEVDPHDTAALGQVDLPTTIYSLILSRIDQLEEREQITMRVASVIGRLFPAAMVWGVYPELGQLQQVQSDLDHLSEMELTPQDQPEPELVYLFKHVLTQEIAYESLLYATRAHLHDQIGQYIERTYPHDLDRYIPLLAHHFERSQNESKKREYLLLAANQARNDFANTVALNYFHKALPLIQENGQAVVYYRMGQVHDTMGDWPAAEEAYRQGMVLADRYDQREINLDCRIEIGDLFRKQSNYDEALSWFEAAQLEAERIGYRAGVAKAWHYKAGVFFFQGSLETARENYLEAVRLRRELGDQRDVTKGLINLGAVSRSLGDTSQARAYQEEAVSILRELNDRWPLATALNNLGNVALDLGQANDARRFLGEAVTIQREIGHQWFLGNALNNLANVAREQGDFNSARQLYGESVTIYRKLNDRWALAYLLEDIGVMKAMEARAEQALRLVAAASNIREAISAPLSPVEQGKLDGKLRPARDALGAMADAHWQAGRGLSLDAALDEAVSHAI